MHQMLIAVMYLIYVSLGLPDSLLGSGWPVMNFLHCFYGVGAIISPSIMALALKHATWHEGYRWTSYIQMGIMLVCILSLPLWNKSKGDESEKSKDTARIGETIRVPGVVFTLIAFFAYCSGEATCFLWTPSYFAGTRNGLSDSVIASFGMLVFFGLMIGRLISGVITNRFGDRKMIRHGIIVEIIGIAMVFLSAAPYQVIVAGFILIGIGMGPVFPGIQHMAPINFDKRYSATVIGLQMASAYVGSSFMPMVFGNIQERTGIGIMPVYLLIFAVLNFGFLELTYRSLKNEGSGQ